MTQLRERMIRDLSIRGRSPNTIRSYVSAVAAFAKHYGTSPESLGQEEIQAYLYYLIGERGLAPSSCNVA